MTLFIAQVATDEEVARAFAEGADAALLHGLFVWPGSVARWTRLVDALDAAAPEPRSIATLRNVLPERGDLTQLRERGFVGAMLDRTTPLRSAKELADAARVVALCRAEKLQCGFAGALEAPDMPRLLALDPDFIVVGSALRHEGSLAPEALRLFRDLITGGIAALDPGSAAKPARPDRIFVRDLVLSMAIGAYASEVGRTQRVRFSVEADLASAARPAQDLRDVVSYDLITDAIAQIVATGHIDLSETVAERIAERVLAHPRVLGVRIVVEKLDLGPGAVGVEIWRERA